MLAVCGGLLSFRRLTQVLGAHHLRPRAEAHLEKGPTTPSTRQLFCCGKYFLGSLCKMQYSHATSLLRQELEKVRTGKKLEKLSCKESYLDILCDLTIQLALVLLLYIYFKLWHRCAPVLSQLDHLTYHCAENCSNKSHLLKKLAFAEVYSQVSCLQVTLQC